ncbi:1,5-anhydro-D-fructose reductase [Hartmannibacter diazotrophicus]|uniref:1,5-anhydro-D-fructose reductase n=1 Tax=Hartmannibacter diazotrophicus TaxID=1482074 RepID=A0A2C9D968_9HYPH|nr:Gfo/Idh/MocA family oxidoreductase [Hartmannibacter diazotrophicus]SON56710.1 1,5-anhydro-D-fructose reductase [Hartmannibacter diazotrophicus]
MLRAAILGLGWWGKTIVGRMKDSQKLRIVRAVELSTGPHAELAAENGIALGCSYDDVLADPEIDAIILTTPNSLHRAQVEAAARAGKHVFCEKPLALTLEDAEAMIAACREAGVILGVGHERRFELAMIELRWMVANDELGTIMHAEAAFSHDKLVNVPATDWRRSAVESPAAGMTAMGIHLTDAFVNLFGPAESVYAATAHRVLDGENGDVVSVICRHKSGPLTYLNATLATPLYLHFAVFGTRAWVEFRNETHPDTVGNSSLTVRFQDGCTATWTFDWTDTVKANLEAFAEAATGGRPYPIPDEEKLQTIAILEAVVRSAMTGNAVKLDG